MPKNKAPAHVKNSNAGNESKGIRWPRLKGSGSSRPRQAPVTRLGLELSYLATSSALPLAWDYIRDAQGTNTTEYWYSTGVGVLSRVKPQARHLRSGNVWNPRERKQHLRRLQ